MTTTSTRSPKKIVLISKTLTLHMHFTFVHFFAILNMKWPNLRFYGERERMMINFMRKVRQMQRPCQGMGEEVSSVACLKTFHYCCQKFKKKAQGFKRTREGYWKHSHGLSCVCLIIILKTQMQFLLSLFFLVFKKVSTVKFTAPPGWILGLIQTPLH